MKQLPVVAAIDRLEHAESLDPAVSRLASVAGRMLPSRRIRDILHGVPTGHPLHPVAVLLPVGAWMSAAVLDALPGTRRAARILVGAGVLTAGPAAVAGLADWSRLPRPHQRVGAVHAAANAVAVTLYAASYLQRHRGREVSGRVLGYLGLATVSASGFLGGHLSFRQSAGANHVEDVLRRMPPGWNDAGLLDRYQDGRMTQAVVEGVRLIIARDGTALAVLAGACSRCGAELEGTPDGRGIVCPEDGSEFQLDGAVVHGPATAPQPRFDAMVDAGAVLVRAPQR